MVGAVRLGLMNLRVPLAQWARADHANPSRESVSRAEFAGGLDSHECLGMMIELRCGV